MSKQTVSSDKFKEFVMKYFDLIYQGLDIIDAIKHSLAQEAEALDALAALSHLENEKYHKARGAQKADDLLDEYDNMYGPDED